MCKSTRIGASNTVAITPKHGINTDSSARRWNALLDCLSVERLTNLFLERVLQLNDYHDGALPASEIRRTATASFGALIESLRPREDSAQLQGAAQSHRLGRGCLPGTGRNPGGVPDDRHPPGLHHPVG